MKKTGRRRYTRSHLSGPAGEKQTAPLLHLTEPRDKPGVIKAAKGQAPRRYLQKMG